MARFTLFQSTRDNQWYFNLKSDNGEPICQSEGYASKYGAQQGIDAVKRLAPHAVVYEAGGLLGSLGR
jgi:uncharacterized protein YegP (UPF0339 family)